MQSTQSRHPWRATARTVLAAALPLLPLLPTIADMLGVSAVPWIAGFLAVVGAVTRLMAIPGVDGWMRRYVPWLATSPARQG